MTQKQLGPERTYLTSKIIEKWETNGKDSITEDFKKFQKEFIEAKGEVDYLKVDFLGFKKLVHELCWTALLKDSSKWHSKILDIFEEHMESTPLCQSAVVDVIWLIWLELDDGLPHTEEKQKFIEFIGLCSEHNMFPEYLLKERLQVDLLESLSVVRSEKIFRKKEIRWRTQTLYRQQKFNLLREESEGFSKLVSELNQYFSSSESKLNVDNMTNRIKSLIGYFNLDPNKVIDIILECFERIGDKNKVSDLIEIISLFNKTSICHILGFKFKNFATNVSKLSLASLHSFTALLIKHNAIELSELYPHLTPKDDEMVQAREDLLKERYEKSKITTVISLSAEVEKTSTDDEKKKAIAKKKQLTSSLFPSTQIGSISQHQKFELLIAFLEHDDWKHAKILLDRLKFIMPAADPRVCRALCKILNDILEPYYVPISGKHKLLFNALTSTDSGSLNTEMGTSGLNVFGGMEMDEMSGKNELDYMELPGKLLPILKHLSVYLFHDCVLFAKICRVLRQVLKIYKKSMVLDEETHSVFGKTRLGKKTYLEKIPSGVEEIIANTLLPAFSLIPSNCGLSSELWGVFHQLSYKTRYSFYGYWKDFLYDNHSELGLQRSQTISKTKYFRKRISAARAKECSRLLVKISFSNPLIAFDLLLDQLQVFDNMIIPVVESMKYMSQFSFDCLVFVLINRLSNPLKSKLKADGLNEAHWFQSLSNFAGNLYQKYPDLDLAPIVQFVIAELKDEHSLDLIILNELISKMTGLEAIEEMSEAQIEGLSGGRTLQAQTATIQLTTDRNRSAQYLLTVLFRENMVFPLFALMAQQKNAIVYQTDTHYVKMIGELYDKCHGVLCQFMKLVSTKNKSDTIYSNLFPSLNSLCIDYNIPPADAFMILRRCLHLSYVTACSEPDEPKEEEETVEDDSSEVEQQIPLVKACKNLLPQSAWSAISPEFYAMFWSMSMYDLHIPKHQYAKQIKRCRSLVEQIDSNASSRLDEKKQKEKELHVKVAQKLKQEFMHQITNHNSVMSKLKKQKDAWLANVVDRNLTVTRFLQYCIFPRCFTSGIDAVYCAKFVDIIHNLGTPWFSVIHFYDQITKSMVPLICSCTANEASRFGQFLKEILKPLHSWKRDKKSYEQECITKASFAIDFYKPHGERLSFPKFLLIVQRWHKVMTKVFSTCLSSNIRMQIGNALLILTQIGSVYPRIKTHGEHLEKLLTRIINDRQHKKTAIKVLATRSHAILGSEKKNWVPEKVFAPTISKKKIPKNLSITPTPLAKLKPGVKASKIILTSSKVKVTPSPSTKLKSGQPNRPITVNRAKTVAMVKLKSGQPSLKPPLKKLNLLPSTNKDFTTAKVANEKEGKKKKEKSEKVVQLKKVKKEKEKEKEQVIAKSKSIESKVKVAEADESSSVIKEKVQKKRAREEAKSPVSEKSIKINLNSSPSSANEKMQESNSDEPNGNESTPTARQKTREQK